MAKKTKYWIYHIPGVKIGVSNNPKHRVITQQKFTEYEILEEHTNAKVVSKRERELQAQYGYPIDRIEYWKTLKWQKKGNKKKPREKAIINTDYKARDAKLKKSVTQYDLKNNFIRKWDGAIDAARSLGKKGGFDITNCCRGKQKTAYNYIWKYAN